MTAAARHLVVIGAQRCGTTYLHDLLAGHPQVAMARPARPEPKVFLDDEVVRRGSGWYDATWFAHAGPGVLVRGEKSTSYVERPDAARRIATVLDDPLLLVQLRDPLERAVSNWAFSTAGGLEDRPLDVALGEELAGHERAWDPARTSVSPYRYLGRGRYADDLAPWVESFGDRLRVTFLEELLAGRESLVGTFRWLGVDPAHEPAGWGTPVNSARGRQDLSVPEGLEDAIRGYFSESDRALATLLGRPLPWPTADERTPTP